METGESEPTFSLANAEAGYQKATENLFGLDGYSAPRVDVQKEGQVKEAVQEALRTRLRLIQERRRQAHASMGPKGRKSSPFDYDKEIATCERAIDVVAGRRSNSDSLVSIVTDLANGAAQKAEEAHIKMVGLIPNVGFLGFGGKDQGSLSKEQDRFEKEKEHISSVLDLVSKRAIEWAKSS